MLRSLFLRIALIGAFFSLPARAPGDLTGASSRTAAPDFTLNNSKGTSVKLSACKGRVVLLDFWGDASVLGNESNRARISFCILFLRKTDAT